MRERLADAGAIVDAHLLEAVVRLVGAVPEPDHRHPGVPQILDQPRLVAQVAQEHDRVALARLEHCGQRQRLVGLLARVPEHHRVAAVPGLDRQRLDRAREEEVGDVPHDGSEQHRRRAAQCSRDRVRPVPELEREGEHALPCLHAIRGSRAACR